jgi:hypothetical protein
VLPARCRMPGPVVFRLCLAKDNAVCLLQDGCLALRSFLRPVDPNVPPMRLAIRVAIEIMDVDPHRRCLYLLCQFGLRLAEKAFGPSI